MSQPTSQELIQDLASHPDIMVRRQAAESLGKIGQPEAVEPLLAALRDSNEWVRYAAVQSLGVLGDRRAVEPLTKRLYDAVWRVRQAAALALGNLGDPRALPVLEQVLGTVREPDVDVREAAQQAIAQIQAGIR